VHAVIRGTDINKDRAQKARYTAPTVVGQVRAIAEAMAMAQVSPDTINYVEAHGTATAIGDPIEIGGSDPGLPAGGDQLPGRLGGNECASRARGSAARVSLAADATRAALHLVALDGAYHEQGAELAWEALGHLTTSEVAEVLERAVRRRKKELRGRGLLVDEGGADGGADPPGQSCRLRDLRPAATCRTTVAAGPSATRAAGREALLRYVLLAVDMDPLSLLCRLATSVLHRGSTP
jgi:Beta-ketoacyl synthase, C-terminal domain